MTGFMLDLQDAAHTERMENVASFIGEDASGSFGIQAWHERFMTSLVFGLARYRIADRPWQYVAVPGALVYFTDNVLTLSTRRYLRDENFAQITALLDAQLVKEEEDLRGMKLSLQRMEEEMIKQLWQMSRGRTGAV